MQDRIQDSVGLPVRRNVDENKRQNQGGHRRKHRKELFPDRKTSLF